MGISLQELSGPRRTSLSLSGNQSFYAASAYKLPLLLDSRAEALAPGSVLLSQLVQMNRGTPKAQWFDAYKKMLAPLPPGSYQLIVHLAYNDDEMQGATADHPDWGNSTQVRKPCKSPVVSECNRRRIRERPAAQDSA